MDIIDSIREIGNHGDRRSLIFFIIGYNYVRNDPKIIEDPS